MAKSKAYKTDIKLIPGNIGEKRIKEIQNEISEKGFNLPKGVLIEDMDAAVMDFFTNSPNLVMFEILNPIEKQAQKEGKRKAKKLEVILLTIQRWYEYTRTWKFVQDEYKDIKIPFITVVRKPDIQQGENQAGLWNIPGNEVYTYAKIPTWDGAREGFNIYKIPQPTPVNITYEIRMFTDKMTELNHFNNKIQKAFQSRQCYISVNGFPMPLHLENIGDESNIDDFENKRFYVQMFEIKLLGYILDPEDFKVIPAINRTFTALEFDLKTKNNQIAELKTIKKNDQIEMLFQFKPKTELIYQFVVQNTIDITKIVEIKNITRIVIYVNNVGKFDGTILNTPIPIIKNDTIKIKVYKSNNTDGQFKLIGFKIK